MGSCSVIHSYITLFDTKVVDERLSRKFGERVRRVISYVQLQLYKKALELQNVCKVDKKSIESNVNRWEKIGLTIYAQKWH